LGKITQSLREYQTPITLVTGKFDKMVKIENLEKFTLKIPQIKTIELESGHNSLIEDTKNYYFEKEL
jgi:hypothetical protein